jgi:lysophospholipase L1-like esterase
MDRSAMFHTSLLQELAPAMDAVGADVLFINIAMFGDTMRRIGECVSGDFAQWLNTAFSWKFDAILLSAGGNDFIDAARDPDPGQGIISQLAGAPWPAEGGECIREGAVSDLVTKWLNPNFDALYSAVQASRHAGIPIFLNNYDTPTARNAPAFVNGRSWLFEAYMKNNIPEVLWGGLTGRIFTEVQSTVAGWAAGKDNVHSVPTNGTLIPADAGTTGSSGDWLNEIHPNASGWEKLAKVWCESITHVL